jgi:aminopeptidase N
MKVTLFACCQLLCLVTTACAATPPPGTITVLQQTIAVTLEPERHLLRGESTLTIAPGGTGKLTLALNSRATVDVAEVAGRRAPFTFAGGLLTVELPGKPGRKPFPLAISYRCLFNDQLQEQVVTTEGPDYEAEGSIAPQGIFLGGGAAWYPAPSVSPRKRTLTVTAPAGIEAVTAGRRAERRTEQGTSVSTWEEAHPVERLSLSAGRYLVEERQFDGVAIYTYFSADNARLAPAYLAAAEKYIRFYSGLLGPFPYEKFAVVENFFPTGYGFPSYTLLGNTVIRLPFIIDTSLPHEILHCWWGNGVFVDYRGGNWSEGLVTYLADHLLEAEKSPEAGREYRFRLLADYAALVPPDKDFPLRDFMARSDPASRAIGYGKGAMVFHMVRRLIGDDAFFRALRTVFRDRLFQAASWDDFTRAFSREGGTDLAPFMTQWLTRPGGPRLALAGVRREGDDGKWRVAGGIEQAPPFYDVRIPLGLETERSEKRQTVALGGAKAPFVFSVAATPSRLVLDPDIDLFRVLSPRELPATVNRVKGAHSLLAVVTRDCRADRDTLGLLLRSLGQGSARIVEEEALDTGAPAVDLLFCGVPRRTELLPAPPPGISYSSHGFTVAGENFAQPDDALFLVAAFPADPDRVAALFLPHSPNAAAKCAVKITHYGRYGYLVFANGENRKKGTILPAASASVVTFPPGGER